MTPEPFKYASTILSLTVALGLPPQCLEAAEDQPKPAAPRAVAEAPLLATKATAIEAGETAPSHGIKAFDALAVRPVTFISSVFSAGAFVLTLPFAALDPAMGVEKTRKNLVEVPFRDTFQRPLGDFNGSAWGRP